MPERPRFFDDLAGVAGGAMSALTGLRDEAEAIMRARVDEAVRALNLVRRDEMDAAEQMAARARAGQEAAEQAMADLTVRVAQLEARVTALEADPRQADPRQAEPRQAGTQAGSPAEGAANTPSSSVGGGPGMIA